MATDLQPPAEGENPDDGYISQEALEAMTFDELNGLCADNFIEHTCLTKEELLAHLLEKFGVS